MLKNEIYVMFLQKWLMQEVIQYGRSNKADAYLKWFFLILKSVTAPILVHVKDLLLILIGKITAVSDIISGNSQSYYLCCNQIWKIQYGQYAPIFLFFFSILRVRYLETVQEAKCLCTLGINKGQMDLISGNIHFIDFLQLLNEIFASVVFITLQ